MFISITGGVDKQKESDHIVVSVPQPHLVTIIRNAKVMY